MERPGGAAAHAVEGAGVNKPLEGIRVLVVDDHACVRRLVKLVLARGGAEVVEADSAETAFAEVCTFRPHLLVSDINMPLEDGNSLMRRIRALDNGWAALLPAIALTGGGGVASHAEARRAGYSAYLTKPFQPGALVDTAVNLLPVSSGEELADAARES